MVELDGLVGIVGGEACPANQNIRTRWGAEHTPGPQARLMFELTRIRPGKHVFQPQKLSLE